MADPSWVPEDEIAFVAKSDAKDDRVNDGANYKGLMRPSEYKAKREQVKQGEEKWKAQRLKEACDRDAEAAATAAKERENRLQKKKLELQQQLTGHDARTTTAAAPSTAEVPAPSERKGKKRKKPTGASSTLSFAAEDEEE